MNTNSMMWFVFHHLFEIFVQEQNGWLEENGYAEEKKMDMTKNRLNWGEEAFT